MTYEKVEVRKPGVNSSGHGCAPDDSAALEHEHLLAGARKVCAAGQAVVTSADDDDVVANARHAWVPGSISAAASVRRM
jgi:hypothetical protein